MEKLLLGFYWMKGDHVEAQTTEISIHNRLGTIENRDKGTISSLWKLKQ